MGVRFEYGDLIPSGAAEAMAASVAAWLEGYLRRNPGELTPQVAKLLGFTRPASGPTSAAGGSVYQR